MGKKLSEMSLEELWLLFPIFLEEHKDCWEEWYREEEYLLKNAFSSGERISHIGSTAIPSIWAKPIVDILVEVPKGRNLLDYEAQLTNNGYICMSQSKDRMSFNKGYTENGFAQMEGIAVLPIWLILSLEENTFFNRRSSSKYHSCQQSLCSSKKIGNSNQSSSKLISDNFFPIVCSAKFLFVSENIITQDQP